MRSLRIPVLAVGCLALILSSPLPCPLWAGIVFKPVEYLPGQAAPEAGTEQKPPASVEWPREFKQNGYTFTAFQPQVDRWQNQVLEARQAVQVTGGDLKQPAFGSVFLEAQTSSNMTTREVTLSGIKITKVDFPTLPAEVTQMIQQKALPASMEVSLDQLTANLARTQDIEAKKTVSIADSPVPEIIVSTQSPAILVLIGGQPEMRDLAGTKYMTVLNTEWVIIFDQQPDTYFLLTDKQWLSSPDLLKGPWQAAAQPAGLDQAPKDSPVALALAQAKLESGAPVPAVYVATQQATLMDFRGQPTWTPVPDTGILYATNIDQPVLKESGEIYALLSGRWFKTSNLEQGPWSYVDPSLLPADFAQIPSNSTLGQEVLVSVPGTPEAKEAVITAQIPHKATINNQEAKLDVTYDGEPKFEPISGTTGLERAINTSYTVIEYQDKYYCCYNAVWFMAAAPTGPWAVTADIPSAIYTIPPTSPAYNVTYVQVYESTPQTTTFGYTAGYLGAFIAGGLLVYGLSTLWRNNYYWCGRYYYPPPYTYGWGYRHYDPWTGVYRARGYWHTPGYWHTAGGRYNPWTGNYAYGHRTATPYASWGRGVVGNVNTGRWAEGGYYDNWRRGSAGAHGSDGNAGFISHNKITGNTVYGGKKDGDYYVGRDGKVYKYDDGSWSKYNDGSWNPVQRPDRDQLSQVNRENLQKNAPEYAQRAQDRVANLTPEQRQAARDRADNISPERRQQVQDRVTQRPQVQRELQRPEHLNFQHLERQRASRNFGQQRSREFHRGIRHGGGGFRHGGGGHRGGGGHLRR
ncbi:MAG: hypothetical protein AAGK14_05330 [Verrucomicrobiota bacterium]